MDVLEVRWHGRGGQGVVTAGKLLADAALDAGLHFQAFPDYGPERMGAPIRAFTRLSRQPIHVHSQITYPNVVVVLDPTVIGAVDVTAGLTEDGIMLINTPMTPTQARHKLALSTGRVFTVNATAIALEHFGKEITNTPMLGALAAATGVFALDDLADQIAHKFERKFGEDVIAANIVALRQAAEQLQEG
jgi:pyruvate ferredoxin oxidoreductase gamma subunit